MPWGANSESRAEVYWSATVNGANPHCASDAEAFFYSLGATGLEWEDGKMVHTPFTDIVMAPGEPFVRAYFPHDNEWPQRKRQLANRYGNAVVFQRLRAEDWENSWKQYYLPVPVGDWMIMPAWYSKSPVSPDHTIWLDPGMAFGTGTHPTTRMCLERVVSLVTTDTRLMDLGSGSGVLAIAAAKALAAEVMAVEPDPVALVVLRDNLERNQVADEVTVVAGTLEDVGRARRFDLIVANLIAEIIVAEWPRIVEHLAVGGLAILCGIVPPRLIEVKAALAQTGAIIRREAQQDDWVILEVAPA